MTTGNLDDYSTTDASNTSIAGINQAENGMKVSDVNGAFRALNASIARWLDDQAASATVGGTATAITVTLAQPFTAYGSSAGQIPNNALIRIQAGSAATGATTLNVNTIGTKKILRPDGSTAIKAGDWGTSDFLTLRYSTAADSATGAWLLLNAKPSVFPNTITPGASDGAALGTTSLMWSDLFLASGAVINFNNGDVTLTHSSNALAFAGASGGYSFDAGVLLSSNDAGALGASGTAFSDLFLASGGVINFNAGDVTITHSANTLAFAGASSGGYTFDKQVSSTGTGNRFYANDMGTSNDFAYVARASSGIGTRYAMVTINNADSTVGSITFDAASTAYNTSSDENIKQGFEDFDSAAIVDGLNVYHYEWKAAPGTYGYGVKAQEAVSVFPQMISVGSGTYGTEDYREWGADYSKLVPVLLREIQSMRVRLAALES